MNKNLQISEKTHKQLKEISKSRKCEESFTYSMLAIVGQLVDKEHKKWCKP